MALPKPAQGESVADYVSRFTSDDQAIEEFPDQVQRTAVAYSTFEEKSYDDLETKKYEDIDFKPTESMANAAKRGLAMREKQPPSNRGGTAVGLARANQLVKRETLSPSTVKRMYSFFSRHEVDKQSDSWKKGNSKGEQAWLLWGGDAGFTWSKNKVDQMEKADAKKSDLNDLETKSFEIEHKNLEIDVLEVKMRKDGKGEFKAILSPYGNIDRGDDIVMETFGKMNSGRVIPLLLGHKVETEHGELHLKHVPGVGVMIDPGILFLEHDEKGNQIFPEAHKTYSLLKRGKDGGVSTKFSMGYRVSVKKYDTMDNRRVRRLVEGIIEEGSRVTFPMNPEALQTNEVKNLGEALKSEAEAVGKLLEGGANKVKMPMGMEQRMAMDDYGRKMNEMPYMFNRGCKECMAHPEMTQAQKMAHMQKEAMFFTQKMMEYAQKMMGSMHDENGMMKKGEVEGLEIKSFEDFEREMKSLEEKAGKDPMKYGRMAAKAFMKGMDYMQKGGMYDPEAQMNPETHKNPEGKSEEDNLEYKGMFASLVPEIKTEDKEGE